MPASNTPDTAPHDPIVRHLLLLMTHPHEQWQAIAREELSVLRLITRIALPFSVMMAVAMSLGVTFFNTDWSQAFGYRSQPGQALVVAGQVVLVSLLSVLLLAWVFHLLAPMYKVKRNYSTMLKVAILGSLPVWLTGFTLVLLPGIIFTVVAFGYSCYLYAVGLDEVCGAPPGEAPEYVAVAMIFHALASSAVGALAGWIGLL
jgi:Yip1 domain